MRTKSKSLLGLLALMLLPLSAAAQSITVPDKVTIETPGLVVIRATAIDCEDCRWYSLGPGLQTFPSDVVPPKLGTYLGFALKEGTYRIGVVPAKSINGKAVIGQPSVITVIVGSPTPDPTPVPPTPPTPPVPPSPPAPIPVDGFRVLIVYESANTPPVGQREIMMGQAVRAYLNSKCTKVGITPEWRILDKDTDMSKESKVWQDAMKLPRQMVPWIVISTGTTGFSGPLPTTLDETMALLKRFGG